MLMTILVNLGVVNTHSPNFIIFLDGILWNDTFGSISGISTGVHTNRFTFHIRHGKVPLLSLGRSAPLLVVLESFFLNWTSVNFPSGSNHFDLFLSSKDKAF